MDANKAKEIATSVLNKLLTHWIAMVAMIYSFSILLNIIYVNHIFEKFSLNPWEFYEAHDIFIGSFMRSSLVMSSLFIVLVAIGVIVLFSTKDKDKDKDKESKSLPAITGIVLATASIYPIMVTQMQAKEDFFNIVFMNNNLVNVHLKNKTRILNLKLISSPGKFHIYYNQNTQQVEIINEGEIIKILKVDKLSISEKEFENEFKLRLMGASRDKYRKDYIIDKSKTPKIIVE